MGGPTARENSVVIGTPPPGEREHALWEATAVALHALLLKEAEARRPSPDSCSSAPRVFVLFEEQKQKQSKKNRFGCSCEYEYELYNFFLWVSTPPHV